MKQSILLADDDTELRQIVKEAILDDFPEAQIEEAANGVSALEMIRNKKFQLVIMDVEMPRKNGVSAIEDLKKIPKIHQPEHLLILSGVADKNEISELTADIRNSYFIAKPCSVSRLKKYFERALQDQNEQTRSLQNTIFTAAVKTCTEILMAADFQNISPEDYFLQDQITKSDLSLQFPFYSAELKGLLSISFSGSCFIALTKALYSSSMEEFSLADSAQKISSHFIETCKKKFNFEIHLVSQMIIAGKDHTLSIKNKISDATQLQTENGPVSIKLSVEALS